MSGRVMRTDTLIVGGGLSGLALADDLSSQGEDFILVEAQERLGGRILTETLSGGMFDLGPAWFWGGQPRMAALVRRFQIPVFEQYSTGDVMFQDQRGALERGGGYALMKGSYRLAGGMGSLITAFARGLAPEKICVNTRLLAIESTLSGITAKVDQNGTFKEIQTRRIAICMPPRIIAKSILFQPALDAAQTNALRAVPTWMAGQAKIVAVYDQPYWRHAGLSGDAISQRGPLFEIHDASPMQGGPYALFGFIGTPPQTRRARNDETLRLSLAQLAALFGDKMADPMHLVLQDWATAPDIATPSDCQPVSHHPAYGLSADLRALKDRGVILASTETAEKFGGFLEGALEAAEQASKIITASETLHP